jgi:hypothetical protein
MPSPIIAPDRLAFLQRLAEARQANASGAQAANQHLITLENRIAQAAQALALGHIGTARAFLEIARRDFDAALHLLPEP